MWVVLLAGVAGVAAQLAQGGLWPAGWYMAALAGALALAGVGWLGRRRAVVALLCGALAAALSGFAATGWRAVDRAADRLNTDLEGVDLVLTGDIRGLPRAQAGGWRLVVDVVGATRAGTAVPMPTRVQLLWRAPVQTPVPGERWQWPVRLQAPHGLLNPGGFDLELWMWAEGVGASGQVRTGRTDPLPLRVQPAEGAWLDRLRQHVRDRVLAHVADARAAGVLAALVVGDQASIDAGDWQVFRDTGVAHLVSVSGLHVTMFAWLAVAVVRGVLRGVARFWPGLLWRVPLPPAAAWGGLALATVYAVFSGWGVPAQRTVWMLVVVTLLRLGVSRWPWPMVWLLAMQVVLWIDPWALLQAGFWLSFVAVGVLMASGAVVGGEQGGWVRVWCLLREQAVVTVALAPLTLLLFGQFSLVGLLANLVAIPWVTLVVTPLAMLGVFWSGLWDLAAGAVQAMAWCLTHMAAWPWATVDRPAVPWGLAMLAVAGGVLLVQRLPWAVRIWGACLVWPVLAYTPPRPDPGRYDVVAPDVGQGGAVVVRTASHALLFDTGPAWGPQQNAAQRVVLPWLRWAGVRLDGVVVSHEDLDHAGGLSAVARAYPRAQWWASFAPRDGSVAVQRCEAGQRWVWDGVPFEVLHPRAEDYGLGLSTNALSCVLKVGEGDRVTLLTGDITLAEETRIALNQPGLRSRLLVAPHHGSKTSSGPVWLNTVQPGAVLIQAGYRNHYGHPAAVVLERYRVRGIPWYDSPHCGAATWRSWVPDQVLCERAEHRRYWHARLPAEGLPIQPVLE